LPRVKPHFSGASVVQIGRVIVHFIYYQYFTPIACHSRTLLIPKGNIRQNPYAFPGTMTKKLLLASTILLVLTFVVMAADVTGKWTYDSTRQTQNGDMTFTTTLDLKVDGGTLTGTVATAMAGGGGNAGGGGGGKKGGMGGPQEIKNGKVDGSNITFTTERPARGGDGPPSVTTYKGTINGDTINLEVTAPGRGGGDPTTTKVTAKRVTT
jgi:hypothetical protein